MKRLVLVIAVMAMSLPTIFAQSVNSGSEPFKMNIHRLNSYLELTPKQADKVYDINELFVENQRESLSLNSLRQEQQLLKVVYSNLKQMKSVLNDEQYRKYVALINITNNNKGVISTTELPEAFLAEK